MSVHTDLLVPITLTSIAIEEIRNVITEKKLSDEYGLRVGIKGGGCGGASFLLGFDRQKETDKVYQIEGISVFVDKRHTMYLLGMEIDFEDGEHGRGFTFNNPQVPRPTT